MVKPFYIESDVPMPQKRYKWSKILDEMLVGDSFLVSTYSDRANAYIAMKRHGYKAISRKTEAGNYRIWRVE